MADDVHTLLLSINATTEVLRDQLSAAEKATADFHRNTAAQLGDIDAQFYRLGESIGESIGGGLSKLKNLVTGGVIAILGQDLLQAGANAIQFTANIASTAQALGVGTDFLQKYRFAAIQTGASASEADDGLSNLAQAIGKVSQGSQTSIALFDQLGVKIFDHEGKIRSLETVYPEVADAIAKIPDAARRAYVAQELLGQGASKLQPLLDRGSSGFNELAAAAQELGVILSDDLIQNTDKVNQKMAALKAIFEAELANLISENATKLEGLATSIFHVADALAKFAAQNPQAAAATLGLLFAGPAGAAVGAGLASGDLDKQLRGSSAIYNRNAAAVRSIPGGRLTTGFLPEIVGGASVLFSSRQGLIDAADQQDADAAQARRNAVARVQSLYALRNRVTADTPAAQGLRNDLNRQIIEAARAGGLSFDDGTKRRSPTASGSGASGSTNINNTAAIGAAQQQISQLEAARAGASGTALATINAEIAERKREISYLRAGVSAEQAKSLASKEGSTISRGENDAKRAAAKAEQDRLRQLANDRAFEGEIRSANEALARAKLALSDTAEGQLAVELQTLRDSLVSRNQQIDDQVAAGRITDAQAARLRAIYAETEVSQETLAQRRKDARLIEEASERTALQLQGSAALLELDDRLATTRAERLKIELQLLDYQERLAKAEQQRVIDDPTSTREQRDQARTRLGQIDAQHSRNVDLVQRQNESPLEGYRRSLEGSVGDINDALENVQVNAFQSLEDGMASVITGTGSVAGAFKKMATSIIADLARIAIQRAILGVLDSSTGGAGGLLRSIFGGGRASGGNVDDSKYYLVGENGPELFAPGRSGTIIPNGALRAPSTGDMRGASRQRVEVSTDVSVRPAPQFYADVEGITLRTVTAAADPLVAAAVGRTKRDLSKIGLPAGLG